MDPYEYITNQEHGAYISDVMQKVHGKNLRQYIEEIGIETQNISFWNRLIRYFICSEENPGEFHNVEELQNWGSKKGLWNFSFSK